MATINGIPSSRFENRNGKLGDWVIKELTFSNDTGTVNVFTVTGDVVVRIIPICKTNVASAAAANIEMGISGTTDAMIASTVATDIDADDIWIDASPDSDIEPFSSIREYIISGRPAARYRPGGQKRGSEPLRTCSRGGPGVYPAQGAVD